MKTLLAVTLLSAPLAITAPAAPAPAVSADTQAEYKKLVDDKTPSMVTIKYVLTMEGRGGEMEREMEGHGLLIDAKGLVLLSNTEFGGGMMMGMMGGGAAPKNIKVLVGDDTEGVDAKLLARDTELDLAWVQIDKPAEKPYPFIDFAKSAEASLGSRVLSVSKMGKFFDRAPVVGELTIGAVTKKPRKLYIPATIAGFSTGVAVFTPSGEAIGMIVTQMPNQEEMEADAAGMMGAMADFWRGTILPASEIVAATKRALETAKNEPAEQKKEEKKDK